MGFLTCCSYFFLVFERWVLCFQFWTLISFLQFSWLPSLVPLILFWSSPVRFYSLCIPFKFVCYGFYISWMPSCIWIISIPLYGYALDAYDNCWIISKNNPFKRKMSLSFQKIIIFRLKVQYNYVGLVISFYLLNLFVCADSDTPFFCDNWFAYPQWIILRQCQLIFLDIIVAWDNGHYCCLFNFE